MTKTDHMVEFLIKGFEEYTDHKVIHIEEYEHLCECEAELRKLDQNPKPESDYDKLLSKIDYIAGGVLDDTLPIYQFKTQMINLKTQLELHKAYLSTQYKGAENE